MATSVILTIDASDLERIAANIAETSMLTHAELIARLNALALGITMSLAIAAPNQTRADTRWPSKLYKSFKFRSSGDAVEITTSTPGKYEWTNFGARPPTGGSGYIYPRLKQALWWPGLAHPIPFVGPPITRKHPGQAGTNWAQPVINDRLYPVTASPLPEGNYSTADVAVAVADSWVTTFTRKQQRAARRGAGFGLGDLGTI